MNNKIKIASFVIAPIVVLGTIFAIMDYSRVMNGKKPIFMIPSMSVESTSVCGNGYCDDSGGKAELYKGLGYQIVICKNAEETTSLNGISCKKDVNFAPFKMF